MKCFKTFLIWNLTGHLLQNIKDLPFLAGGIVKGIVALNFPITLCTAAFLILPSSALPPPPGVWSSVAWEWSGVEWSRRWDEHGLWASAGHGRGGRGHQCVQRGDVRSGCVWVWNWNSWPGVTILSRCLWLIAFLTESVVTFQILIHKKARMTPAVVSSSLQIHRLSRIPNLHPPATARTPLQDREHATYLRPLRSSMAEAEVTDDNWAGDKCSRTQLWLGSCRGGPPWRWGGFIFMPLVVFFSSFFLNLLNLMQIVHHTRHVYFQKGLDSAIVDCGNAMSWNSHEDNVRVHF